MISLTPSHLIEHAYCPRYTYFQYVLNIPQYEDKYGKVRKGRGIHDLKLVRNKGYLRKRLGVIDRFDDQYLTGKHLRGIPDEVLVLRGGYAPLDYKFAEWKGKVHTTYLIQLTAYARLVEENYNGTVERGYLVYVRSRNHVVEVPIGRTERKMLDDLIADVTQVISENYYPRPTKTRQQCLTCTFRNVCTG